MQYKFIRADNVEDLETKVNALTQGPHRVIDPDWKLKEVKMNQVYIEIGSIHHYYLAVLESE